MKHTFSVRLLISLRAGGFIVLWLKKKMNPHTFRVRLFLPTLFRLVFRVKSMPFFLFN